jgi:hypothetical protein
LVFGVPTDGLVWLLAGVGLGIVMAMGGFALVAMLDRRAHRGRIRSGRRAVAAAIAEDAKPAETPEKPRIAPPKAVPQPRAPEAVPAPATPAMVKDPAVPRFAAALKAAGTAFAQKLEAKPTIAPADAAPAPRTAAVPTPEIRPVVAKAVPVPAPDLLPRPPRTEVDTMPAPPLLSVVEPKSVPVKDEVIKAAASKTDAFPVSPRRAHIKELPPIVDDDIIIEPVATPKPKKPLSEKDAAIAAAAAQEGRA